jgi:hypothetical protein
MPVFGAVVYHKETAMRVDRHPPRFGEMDLTIPDGRYPLYYRRTLCPKDENICPSVIRYDDLAPGPTGNPKGTHEYSRKVCFHKKILKIPDTVEDLYATVSVVGDNDTTVRRHTHPTRRDKHAIPRTPRAKRSDELRATRRRVSEQQHPIPVDHHEVSIGRERQPVGIEKRERNVAYVGVSILLKRIYQSRNSRTIKFQTLNGVRTVSHYSSVYSSVYLIKDLDRPELTIAHIHVSLRVKDDADWGVKLARSSSLGADGTDQILRDLLKRIHQYPLCDLHPWEPTCLEATDLVEDPDAATPTIHHRDPVVVHSNKAEVRRHELVSILSAVFKPHIQRVVLLGPGAIQLEEALGADEIRIQGNVSQNLLGQTTEVEGLDDLPGIRDARFVQRRPSIHQTVGVFHMAPTQSIPVSLSRQPIAYQG